MDKSKHKGIKTNKWLKKSNYSIYYNDSRLNIFKIKSFVFEIKPNYIYFNSIFSLDYFILPIFLLFNLPNLRFVLAPRGMLGSGAIKIKSIKKITFLNISKTLPIFQQIIWHPTSFSEKNDILKFFTNAKTFVIPNIPSLQCKHYIRRTKEPNVLKLIYISRVSPKKNLLGSLEALNFNFKGSIVYDIYGPIEDQKYWLKCKKVISSLPSNLKISYKGSLKHNEIPNIVTNYHFLFLLTKNENYGHVIIETLNCSCPVIISNQTPFNHLYKKKLGWDLCLEKSNVNDVLNKALIMSQHTYDIFSKSAFLYSFTQNSIKIKNKYIKLFS